MRPLHLSRLFCIWICLKLHWGAESCRITGDVMFLAALIFLPWWLNGGWRFWETILRGIYYGRRFRTVFNVGRSFAWMRWWCCMTTCTPYRRCLQMMPAIQNAGVRLKNISLNPGSLWAARRNPARRPASPIVDEVSGNVTTQNILYAMKQITNGILTTSITIR